MLDNMRVLDETNISIKVYDGLLEVFDQHDKLVGEAKLPIPVDENMDIERIYSVAVEYGYDIGQMITGIIGEAVQVEKSYDVWLTEESMIFYSPSAGEFVAEPYIGLFAALGQYFQDRDDNGQDGAEDEDMQPEVEDQNEEDTYEPTEEPSDEGAYEPFDSDDANSEPEENPEESEEPSYEALEADFTEPEEEPEQEPEEGLSGEIVYEAQPKEEPEEAVLPETVEETQEEAVAAPAELSDAQRTMIADWKKAYISTLRENREESGTKLSDLRDAVLNIILTDYADVFEASESEVLFKLLDTAKHVFEAKTALHAGMYQAYLISKDGI